jgi:hypothetical protein
LLFFCFCFCSCFLYLSTGGERIFGFKHCRRWKEPQNILWWDICTETRGK